MPKHFVTPVTWQPSAGLQGRLVPTPTGTWRTAHPVHGVGAHGIYHRHASREKFTPPYTLTGRILVHSILDPPIWIEVEQREPTWEPGITFHPCYPSNDDNWGSGSSPVATRTSVYTELGGTYGHNTWASPGFRFRGPPMPLYDGQWHDFRIEVPEHGSFEQFIDGFKHSAGREATPSFSGANSIAFRIDFHDVELADVVVLRRDTLTAQPSSFYNAGPTRVFDSRSFGTQQPIASGTTQMIQTGAPAGTTAVAVNLAAVGTGNPGYLTAWATGSRPGTSSLNFAGSGATSNGVIVPVDSQGRFRVFVAGGCHLIADVTGWFVENA